MYYFISGEAGVEGSREGLVQNGSQGLFSNILI